MDLWTNVQGAQKSDQPWGGRESCPEGLAPDTGLERWRVCHEEKYQERISGQGMKTWEWYSWVLNKQTSKQPNQLKTDLSSVSWYLSCFLYPSWHPDPEFLGSSSTSFLPVNEVLDEMVSTTSFIWNILSSYNSMILFQLPLLQRMNSFCFN